MIAQTDRQKVLAVYPAAVAVHGERRGRWQWQIVSAGRALSDSCSTEAAAWASALRRLETGRR